MKQSNLFSAIPQQLQDELFESLLDAPGLRLERIVSQGQATPPGEWYDQEWHEWVVLLTGSAGLRIEGQAEVIELQPGDYVLLPAHQRHRVEWTQPDTNTVWLALHYQADTTTV